MGIDIELSVGIKKEIDEKAFNRIRNIWRDYSTIDGDIEEIKLDSFDACYYENVDKLKGLFNISSCTRLYSENYARGPFLHIFAAIEFLKRIFKKYDPVIYYCGDCDSEMREVSDERINSLFEYFINKGGEDYYRYKDYNKPFLENERSNNAKPRQTI